MAEPGRIFLGLDTKNFGGMTYALVGIVRQLSVLRLCYIVGLILSEMEKYLAILAIELHICCTEGVRDFTDRCTGLGLDIL